MKHIYKTQGTCARAIEFEIVDGVLRNVTFSGGCSGNSKGISMLVEGMRADEVEKRLIGISCGFRDTSCPDQLAIAVSKALEKEKQG